MTSVGVDQEVDAKRALEVSAFEQDGGLESVGKIAGGDFEFGTIGDAPFEECFRFREVWSDDAGEGEE
jgi:hypothetical protein